MAPQPSGFPLPLVAPVAIGISTCMVLHPSIKSIEKGITMRTLIFTAIIVMVCGTASAEFYRYVDKQGNVLYTDDLSKVPIEQRKTLAPYQNSPGTRVPAQITPENQGQPATEASGAEKERRQLEQQEKALNQEYEQLTKERDALDKDKDNAVTPDQVKTYNQRIADFNERIKGYEKKHAAHTEKVTSFNERLNNSDAPERK